MTDAKKLAAANDARIARHLPKLVAEMRRMEAAGASGELVFRVTLQSGGFARWKVETSKGGNADDE